MSPLVKYTLGRLGLFLAVLLVLWPVPQLSPLVKLLAALVGSFLLSWFLLRRWRDELSASLADRLARRRAERERLRAALAGEDDPGPPPGDHR
jgi:threonine/homoserine/homoserine lactone efflux protein